MKKWRDVKAGYRTTILTMIQPTCIGFKERRGCNREIEDLDDCNWNGGKLMKCRNIARIEEVEEEKSARKR